MWKRWKALRRKPLESIAIVKERVSKCGRPVSALCLRCLGLALVGGQLAFRLFSPLLAALGLFSPFWLACWPPTRSRVISLSWPATLLHFGVHF